MKNQWNMRSFEGQSDLQLVQLLMTVSDETDGDQSDHDFMDAIRKELLQRIRGQEGKKRTWGNPEGWPNG